MINPDGRVKEMVTGVVGRSCEEVTRKIEEQLGNVISRENTSDYFSQKGQQTATTETHNRATYSDWG
ncbi:MAG: DUF2997 domain-containing protein [Leptolyngbyaceae cyanobacterium]